MASVDDNPASIPAPPPLVAPRNASVVDGREVTFVWDPVDGATSYRLQIAPTARFDDPVLDQDVGSQTAVTVGNHFSTDGNTFFWRVRAGNDAGWSAGEAVDSFVAASSEEAEHPLTPAAEHPVTGLARSTRGEESSPRVTPHDQFEREKERGVAYEGVATKQILSAAAAVLVVVSVAVVVIFGWYGQVVQETEISASGPQNYERMQQVTREATQRLNEYGVVDEEEGVYHIPIQEAMDITIREQYQQSPSNSESSSSDGSP